MVAGDNGKAGTTEVSNEVRNKVDNGEAETRSEIACESMICNADGSPTSSVEGRRFCRLPIDVGIDIAGTNPTEDGMISELVCGSSPLNNDSNPRSTLEDKARAPVLVEVGNDAANFDKDNAGVVIGGKVGNPTTSSSEKPARDRRFASLLPSVADGTVGRLRELPNELALPTETDEPTKPATRDPSLKFKLLDGTAGRLRKLLSEAILSAEVDGLTKAATIEPSPRPKLDGATGISLLVAIVGMTGVFGNVDESITEELTAELEPGTKPPESRADITPTSAS